MTQKREMTLRIEQWMMRYLRKRGWVVFWLDEEARTCPIAQVKHYPNQTLDCWLALYESDRLYNNNYSRPPFAEKNIT